MPKAITLKVEDGKAVIPDGVEVNDGKLVVVPASEHEKLASLNAELANKAEKLEKSLSAFSSLVDIEDGEDPVEKLKQALENEKELKQKIEAGEAKGKKEVEELIKKRLQEAEEAFRKQLEEKEKLVNDLQTEVEKKQQVIVSKTMDSMVTQLLQKEDLGLNPTAAKALKAELAETFHWDSEKNDFVPRTEEGTTMWEPDSAGTPISPESFVKHKLIKAAPYLFNKSEGAGAHGADRHGNAITKEEARKMSPEDLWSSF